MISYEQIFITPKSTGYSFVTLKRGYWSYESDLKNDEIITHLQFSFHFGLFMTLAILVGLKLRGYH